MTAAALNLATEMNRCRPWIDAALEYSGGTHDFGDVLNSVMAGHMQLWPAPKGCMVTEIVVYPKKKVLHIFLAGGELDQILDMEGSIINWGKRQGCESLSLAGRKGWTKVLADRGWQYAHAIVSKEI